MKTFNDITTTLSHHLYNLIILHWAMETPRWVHKS